MFLLLSRIRAILYGITTHFSHIAVRSVGRSLLEAIAFQLGYSGG